MFMRISLSTFSILLMLAAAPIYANANYECISLGYVGATIAEAVNDLPG